MSNPKKHHYVPQCYLNSFRSFENGHLFALNFKNKGKPKIKEKYPGGICYIPYYYSLDGDLIFDSIKRPEFYIELKVNQYYENNFPNLLKNLINQESISIDDAKSISDFLIHLKVRNPYQNILNENSKNIKIKEIANRKYHFMRQTAIDRGYPLDIFHAIYQNAILRLKNNEKLIKGFQSQSLIQKYENPYENNKKFRDAILSSSWTLLENIHDNEYFITTDNPGVAIDNFGTIHNTKFVNGFKFFLPLSPNHTLEISDSNGIDKPSTTKSIKRKRILPSTVSKINKLSSCVASKYLISNSFETLNKFINDKFP